MASLLAVLSNFKNTPSSLNLPAAQKARAFMILFAGYCSLYLSTSFVSVVSYTSERIVLLFPI